MGVYFNRLPSTFQEVEYIQSTGTQWIDTGHKHNANTKFEIKFAFQSMTTTRNGLCGARTNYISYDDMDFFVHYASGGYTMRYGCGGHMNDSWLSVSLDTPYEATLTKDMVTLGGTSLSISTSLTSCNYNDWLFSVNNSGNHADYIIKAKVYYFKIYDNGILTRDFVPCYRKSDNVIGMYDLVNNVFYTNQGSGTFTKGNNVVGLAAIKNAYVGEYGWQPGANTIAYYPLTSTSTVNDLSGNNHTMAQSGGTFGTYQGASCLSLSANDYLSCVVSQLPQGNNPITISCWCWLNNVSGEQGIFGYGRNSSHGSFQFAYAIYDRMGIRTYYDDCTFSGISSYLGKWIYITGTSDGSSIKFYIDGQLKETQSHSQNMQDTTLYIGKGILSNGMTGYISNAIIENKARTAQEVSDYYNQTKSNYGL